MKIPKILLTSFIYAAIFVFGVACNVNSVATPMQISTVEVTRIVQISSTPLTIQVTHDVTREVMVKMKVEVTPIPEPPLAKECFDNAMRQGEINSCALLEYELEQRKLDETIARIKKKIPEKDMQELELIQATWQKQMEHDCDFFAGRMTTDENGNSHYLFGSMAPMNIGFCLANHTKERIIDLKIYFLD